MKLHLAICLFLGCQISLRAHDPKKPVEKKVEDTEGAEKKADSVPKAALKYTREELAALYPPESCEGIYYGLFWDKEQKKERKEFESSLNRVYLPGSAKTFDATQPLSTMKSTDEVFKKIKFTYSDLFRPSRTGPDAGIFGDWFTRISAAELFPTPFNRPGSLGAFMLPGDVVRERKDVKDLLGNSLGKAAPGSSGEVTVSKDFVERIQSEAADSFNLGHELAHSMLWGPLNLLRCLSSEDSIAARSQHYNDWDPLAPKKSGMQRGDGMGEEWVKHFEGILRDKGIEAAKGRAAVLSLENNLPSQLYEAVADHYGIQVAANYIKKNYTDPKSQRDAALAILFSMPPDGYKPDAAEILNTVGSKKLNEKRVERLLLANVEFQKIIGCKSAQKNPPKQCPNF